MQVQGCGLTGISETQQEKRRVFRNFYSQLFLPLPVNPESQGRGETKGTVLLSGVWTQFPERRARSF